MAVSEREVVVIEPVVLGVVAVPEREVVVAVPD